MHTAEQMVRELMSLGAQQETGLKISVPEPREKQQAYENQGCQGITLHAPDLIATQTKQHNLQSVLG